MTDYEKQASVGVSPKARTEQPVEVGNIGKARLQSNVCNANFVFAFLSKQHKRPL